MFRLPVRHRRDAPALADHAICTIPAPVLKDIPNDFSPATQAALDSFEFVEAVKVAFQAKRRFWEEDAAIFGGISWTDNDITQVWYPCNGYHRSKGVLVGACIWGSEPGLRYTALSAPERLRAALAEGEPLHPGYAGEMECGISRAWLNLPFQKGCWPRRNEDAAAALRRARHHRLPHRRLRPALPRTGRSAALPAPGSGWRDPLHRAAGGSGRTFTWMLTAGVAIAIGGNIHLDLSYRYTDAGELRTDAGDIAIVRYREDSTRREIRVPINETSADYWTHSVLAALRFEF